MADPVAWTVVERGWAVVASDGSEVGKVDKVLGESEADIFDGLAAGAGTALDRPVYVPSEQVGRSKREPSTSRSTPTRTGG
jgi:rRNA processing protein Gar1